MPPKREHNRDVEREALRRAAVKKLWLLGYDAADICARLLEALDFKHLLKGYEAPLAAIRNDCDRIWTELQERYPGKTIEQIQYMERCREVYRLSLLQAEELNGSQARAMAVRNALEANEALGRVQGLPVEGIGKVKPDADKDKKDEDDQAQPGFNVTPPKGVVTEITQEELDAAGAHQTKRKKKQRKL